MIAFFQVPDYLTGEEVKYLKQKVRDFIDPGRDLGHLDRSQSSAANSSPKQDRSGTNFPENSISNSCDGKGTEALIVTSNQDQGRIANQIKDPVEEACEDCEQADGK